MSILTPQRVEQEELLDEHDAPWDDMVRSLEDLRHINRFAGGVAAYRRILRRLAGTRDLRSLRILDLGTGTADLPASIRPHTAPIGLDVNLRHLHYGRARWGDAAERVAGDAFHLPIADGGVDVVTSSHFAHHFTLEENVRIIHESLRVAKVGVAITDTRRHHAPLLFVRFLGAVGAIGRITKFDAPASVLRAYTVPEVRDLAARIECSRIEVVRLLPFRWGLLAWK